MVHMRCARMSWPAVTAIHNFEGEKAYSEKHGHYFVLNDDFAAMRRSIGA